jgi:hypothetical protein
MKNLASKNKGKGVEYAYAVRIGRPPKSVPYLMLRDSSSGPALFDKRDNADRARCINGIPMPHSKVVLVKLTYSVKT